MFVKVAIDLALDRLFTYSVPVELTEKLLVGQLLRVPFSGRIARGFAMAVETEPPSFKTKPVLSIEDESPFFSPALLKLVKWIAGYYAAPIETTLRAALPAAVLKPSAKPKELLFVEPGDPAAGAKFSARQQELLNDIRRVGGGWMQQLVREFRTTPSTLKALAGKGALVIAPRVSRRDPLAGRRVMPTQPLPLGDEQAAALATIMDMCHAPAPRRPVLLHGVTGSGKTEVYLQAIAQVLDEGRDAIVLVPEISLTPQTVRRFAGRFGDKVAVLHSALSDGERYDEWHRIRTGEARVVVGPRSAVFAPVRRLGLIVVDEEHDPSYKQDESPRYHARDVAAVRASLEDAVAVLGSATPSLETWLNAQSGKFALAAMPSRVAGRSLPAVHLVNMEQQAERTGRAPIFSDFLLDAIHLRLERGEQTILFLNRRGFSRVLECGDCGWVAECPDCSVPYTYHQADNCLRCHVCGGWIHVPPQCPNCHSKEFSYTGIGTQRAEAALKRCFQHARVLRMDADSTSRKYSHDDILSAFRAGKADVLLGTQMIAKGLDFPNVTLVGVLNADTSLHRPDPRASERTYQRPGERPRGPCGEARGGLHPDLRPRGARHRRGRVRQGLRRLRAAGAARPPRSVPAALLPDGRAAVPREGHRAGAELGRTLREVPRVLGREVQRRAWGRGALPRLRGRRGPAREGGGLVPLPGRRARPGVEGHRLGREVAAGAASRPEGSARLLRRRRPGPLLAAPPGLTRARLYYEVARR